MIKVFPNIRFAIDGCMSYLRNTGQIVENNSWQGIMGINGTFETYDVAFKCIIPENENQAQELINANLPWAEEHFQERISGIPYNPPPSHERWPFRIRSNEGFLDKEKKFNHTYPERFWPKVAGMKKNINHGIRYPFGDFNDLINQLYKNPTTRQAYLPIFFPEDTGAVKIPRVPCTLGYGFYLRNGFLYIEYTMRATDALRHFRDDLYMAVRLAQTLLEVLKQMAENDNDRGVGDCVWCKAKLGMITFHTFNFHVFSHEKKLI